MCQICKKKFHDVHDSNDDSDDGSNDDNNDEVILMVITLILMPQELMLLMMITLIMMIAMIRNLMSEGFMVMLQDLMILMIMMLRNSMVTDFIMPVKITKEHLIACIIQGSCTYFPWFKIQGTKRNPSGFWQWVKLWLLFYNQTVGGGVQRAIRMSGRKYSEIYNLFSANRKTRKWENH